MSSVDNVASSVLVISRVWMMSSMSCLRDSMNENTKGSLNLWTSSKKVLTMSFSIFSCPISELKASPRETKAEILSCRNSTIVLLVSACCWQRAHLGLVMRRGDPSAGERWTAGSYCPGETYRGYYPIAPQNVGFKSHVLPAAEQLMLKKALLKYQSPLLLDRCQARRTRWLFSVGLYLLSSFEDSCLTVRRATNEIFRRSLVGSLLPYLSPACLSSAGCWQARQEIDFHKF